MTPDAKIAAAITVAPSQKYPDSHGVWIEGVEIHSFGVREWAEMAATQERARMAATVRIAREEIAENASSEPVAAFSDAGQGDGTSERATSKPAREPGARARMDWRDMPYRWGPNGSVTFFAPEPRSDAGQGDVAGGVAGRSISETVRLGLDDPCVTCGKRYGDHFPRTFGLESARSSARVIGMACGEDPKDSRQFVLAPPMTREQAIEACVDVVIEARGVGPRYRNMSEGARRSWHCVIEAICVDATPELMIQSEADIIRAKCREPAIAAALVKTADPIAEAREQGRRDRDEEVAAIKAGAVAAVADARRAALEEAIDAVRGLGADLATVSKAVACKCCLKRTRPMRTSHKEMKEVDVVDDVTCNRCGESCRGHIRNVNGINAVVCGSYDSTHFHDDGQNVMIDVCEKCSAEWFATFKHNPLNRPEDICEHDYIRDDCGSCAKDAK